MHDYHTGTRASRCPHGGCCGASLERTLAKSCQRRPPHPPHRRQSCKPNWQPCGRQCKSNLSVGTPYAVDTPSNDNSHCTPFKQHMRGRREGDFATTFSFASPENQVATGPLAKFTSMLQTQLYKSLVRHAACTSLNRMQVSEVTYMELVHVTGQVSEGWALPPYTAYHNHPTPSAAVRHSAAAEQCSSS